MSGGGKGLKTDFKKQDRLKRRTIRKYSIYWGEGDLIFFLVGGGGVKWKGVQFWREGEESFRTKI
jgi:hypothetical protein